MRSMRKRVVAGVLMPLMAACGYNRPLPASGEIPRQEVRVRLTSPTKLTGELATGDSVRVEGVRQVTGRAVAIRNDTVWIMTGAAANARGALELEKDRQYATMAIPRDGGSWAVNPGSTGRTVGVVALAGAIFLVLLAAVVGPPDLSGMTLSGSQ